MQQPLSSNIFTPWRRIARLSTVLRIVWLIVAGLHGWLIARRVVTGEWLGAFDCLRVLLCLAAVWYASLKFWKISTIFDASPRRAWTFALILVLGHWLVQSPMHQRDPASSGYGLDFATVMVVLPVVGCMLLGVGARRRSRPREVRRDGLARSCRQHLDPRQPIFFQICFSPQLFRRPPPSPA